MSLLWQSTVMNFNKTLFQTGSPVTNTALSNTRCHWSQDDSSPLPGSPLCTSTPKRKEPLGSSFETDCSESYQTSEDVETVFGSKKFSKVVRNAISSTVAAVLDMSDAALDAADETCASLPDISHSCCSMCDQSEFLDSDLRDNTYSMADLPLWNDESLHKEHQSRDSKKNKSLAEKLKKIRRMLHFGKEGLRFNTLAVV